MIFQKSLKEECGIVGIYGDKQAAHYAYLCLYALQHRGQEACGIASLNLDEESPAFHTHKGMGLVNECFNPDVLARIAGTASIGHVRYSTSGSKSEQNIQPFTFNSAIGPLGIAHNGNLTNAAEIRKRLENEGSIFRSNVDSEVFIHLLARSPGSDISKRIAHVMSQVEGAYSLVILSKDKLYAVRDPFGFRPLVIGKLKEAYVAVSETCALDLIDAKFVREVEPGEMVEIDLQGIKSHFPLQPKKPSAFCSFEPIYFARPDSRIFGQEIYQLRQRMGIELAKESPADVDAVIAVPDSGVPMAMGYGRELGIPVELGLVRNHYVGRTFIQPQQDIRDFSVKLKLNPVPSVLKDKRIAVIDDSIVRGTTSIKILRMLRAAGAKEIHLRVGSPPITHSCYYGVDTPNRENLLAAQQSVAEMREFLGADSLGFLSPEGLKRALGQKNENSYCMACFTGKYREAIHSTIKPQPTDKDGPGLFASN